MQGGHERFVARSSSYIDAIQIQKAPERCEACEASFHKSISTNDFSNAI